MNTHTISSDLIHHVLLRIAQTKINSQKDFYQSEVDKYDPDTWGNDGVNPEETSFKEFLKESSHGNNVYKGKVIVSTSEIQFLFEELYGLDYTRKSIREHGFSKNGKLELKYDYLEYNKSGDPKIWGMVVDLYKLYESDTLKQKKPIPFESSKA